MILRSGRRNIKTDDELNAMKSTIDMMKNEVYKFSALRSEYRENHANYVKMLDKFNDSVRQLDLITQSVSNIDVAISISNQELNTLKDAPVCSITQEDIDVLAKDIKLFDNNLGKKKHILHYYGIVQKLLKDDGLKTKIIRKFLPIINATVNMYLDKFNFPINFDFDENFNETIQSKFRSDFSYYSFSEGEKSRIDLALLFTWRDISLKKSRNVTNIIIFDEIFQSSLDGSGIDNFMSILGAEDGKYNEFIISHNSDIISSRFDRNLIFNKIGHFSLIEEK